ncbi:MAG: hypothetical protein ACQESZ_05015 [Bacteroidota bacterium]
MQDSSLNNTLCIIAESIPGNVAIIKPDGDICCVNQNWIDFGHKNGISIKTNWLEYNYYAICKTSDGEDSEIADDVLQGMHKLINKTLESVFFEYACHSPFEKRWFELRAKRIEIQDSTFICLIHNNVTEKVKAQIKLSDSQKMFRIITENAPYGVGLSKGNTTHYANPKLLEYLEYDNFQDYVNTPLSDTVHPDDKHIIDEKLRLIRENKADYPFNVKLRFITTKGKSRFFSVDVYEVEIDKEKYNLVNVVDETDKRIAERSEKQLVIDALYLYRKQEILESFSQFLESLGDKKKFGDEDLSQFSQIKQEFKFHAKDWELMKTHFRLIHKDFFETLSGRYPSLTQHDLNFCAMLKLNFATKEMARYLNIKESSVKRQKVRLKKKLELGQEDSLIAYVQSI